MADSAKHIIDAAGESLGRVASRAALALQGKNLPVYERYKVPFVKVKIINAAQVKITGKKRVAKLYTRYSGYPGGLRFEALGQLITRRGYGEAFRRAIKRMLPNNKLRAGMLKNLMIEDGR